ncbi:MAG: glutathione S-transferase family protein [Erythrobacter sp.]
MTYTLYGMAASLYTARVRSYMRINGVPFVELKAGGEEFVRQIVPQLGRWIIPVIKTPSGEIIQDGADIIDHLDAAGFSRHPVYPQAPQLLALAHLFELFGSHGLLRPAMHYRWNFDEENLAFIRNAFRDVLPSGLPREAEDAVFAQASGRMRQATVAFGVNPGTHALVEQRYTQFLALFDRHLADHPFILGGHPTLADYGMIGAMYAHLGRDPAPLHLMQTTAYNVFRWTERMNMRESFIDENHARAGGRLFAADDLPDTLTTLMQFITADYLVEIAAHVEHANAWLCGEPAELGLPPDARPQAKSLGLAPFTWHGAPIETVVLPYRFYLLQRLQDAVDRQDAGARAAIRSLFASTGGDRLLDLRTSHPVVRIGNREVWGEQR